MASYFLLLLSSYTTLLYSTLLPLDRSPRSVVLFLESSIDSVIHSFFWQTLLLRIPPPHPQASPDELFGRPFIAVSLFDRLLFDRFCIPFSPATILRSSLLNLDGPVYPPRRLITLSTCDSQFLLRHSRLPSTTGIEPGSTTTNARLL